MDITKGRNSRKKKLTIIAIATLAGLLVAGASTFSYQAVKRSQQIIQDNIKKQLSFSVLWTGENSPLQGNKKTFKFNEQEKLLSFIANDDGGNSVTISEQPTPESFVDIPQSYDKLIDSMHKYKTFDSAIGRVFLTRPDNLNGKQAAVMNSKGVLLFAKADTDIDDDTWVKLFNNLVIIQ